MSRQKSDGLPAGVYKHGKGFRGRYRPDTESNQSHWSRVFPTPELCFEFVVAAEARWSEGLPTPKLWGNSTHRTFTFADYALEVWWPTYVRDEQADNTQRATRSLLEQHVLTAVWTRLPLAEITRARLQDWFDVRVDDAVPERLRVCTDYSFDADLVAVREATGSGRRATIARLRLVRWTIRQVFDLACADKDVELVVNPAAAVKLKRLAADERLAEERRGRDSALASVVTREQVKAYVRMLPDCDQIPFWLMYACGLRISEAYGTEVRDWESVNCRLSVVRQRARRVLSDGTVEWTTTRMKTRASERYVYVYPPLAARIDAYIERYHGPKPDPSAPLCVGAAGTSTQYGLRPQFRKRLTAAGEYARHTVITPDGREIACMPRPHSLRKAIASELHRCATIPDAAVSAFLGHRLPRHFAGAAVTAIHYLSPFDDDLRACASYIGSIVDAIGGLSVAGDASLQYVTPKEAAALLGCTVSNVYILIRNARLTGIRDGLMHYDSNRTARVYLDLAEVERYRDGRIPPTDVAIKFEDVLKTLQIGPRSARRMLNLPTPELVRWRPANGLPAPTQLYVTVESVERVRVLRARVDVGELLGPQAAQRLLPMVARRAVRDQVPHVILRGTRHYERDVLIRLSEESRPDGHIRVWEGAQRNTISNEGFVELAGLAGDAAVPWAWIPQKLADDVGRARATERADAMAVRQAARAMNPVVDAAERPSAELWVPVVEAAARLSVTPAWVERQLSGRDAPRHRYDQVVYARRADVERLAVEVVPDGFLTTGQVADRVGRTQGWVSNKCQQGQFDAKVIPYPGRKRRYLIPEEAVRAWLLRNDAGLAKQQINVYEAARELQVQVKRLVQVIDAGELACDANSVNTVLGRNQARIRRSDLEAFRVEHMPAPTALTVREVCDALADDGIVVTEAFVHRALRKGQVPGAVVHIVTGPAWWLPPSAIARITALRAEGYLRPGPMLEAAGFEPTRKAYRHLKQLTVRGLVPGAAVPPATYQAVYSRGAAGTVRRLLIERGLVPVREAEDDGETRVA